MGKYRKILVAFDGSESSKNALRQAIALARSEQSWIKMVAVMPMYEGDLELVGVSNIGDVVKGPSEKLVNAAQEIARTEEYPILTDVEQGEPYEKVLDVAIEENCDLIVMGRRGRRDIERALMGSVTYRVISHSDRDVLVVPRETTLAWKKILIATDGSDYSDTALKRAIVFAASHGSSLTAVAVADIYPEYYADAPAVVEKMEQKAQDILKATEDKAKAEGQQIETALLRGEAHEEIVNFAKDNGFDIIFMGSRGRSGIKKLVLGSVTEKVIGLSTCPVFVIKAD